MGGVRVVADELKNEGGDNQFWIEQYGKVLALETLVVTLLASHARTFPNGVAAQMLGDPNAAAKEYGRIMGADGSDLPAGYLTRAKEEVACTRFRRHRVRCFHGTGGGSERRKFTREFKLEAVRLIKDRGVSYTQASADLGVHQSQLRDWVKKFADDAQHAFPGQGQMKPEQLEIVRLKREVTKLKAERDILKKAAAYFAKEST